MSKMILHKMVLKIESCRSAFSSFVKMMLSFLVILTITACNPAQTELGEDFVAGVSISLSNSELSVSNPQVATSNSVTITLSLKDQNGVAYISKKPVVTFSVTGGTSAGTLSAVTNNNNGTYSATFTGVTPGTAATIYAQVDGQELLTSTLLTIQVTTGNYSLAYSVVTVSAETVASNSAITATLTARDISDTQLPDGGLTVLFSHSGGTSTGTFSATTDNHDGTYTATLTGVTAGTATDIHATIGGATVTSLAPTVTVSAGAAANIAVLSGNSQSAVAGSAVTNPLIAVVKDSNNNVKSGVTVSWLVTAGGGAVSSCTTTTDASGLAQCTFTTGTTAGTNTITASVAGIATPATFMASGTAGAAASIAISSGNAQSGTVGSALALPLIVIVKDSNNNVINGEVVDWAVTAGDGAVSSCTPTTNSSGLAQCTLTMGTTIGTNTVTATVDGTAITASFGATGTAGAISLAQSTLTISSSSVTSNSPVTLTITLKDTYGNQVASSLQASNLAITVLATGTSSGIVGSINAVGGNDGAYEASFTGTTAGTANTIKASLSATDFTSSKTSFTVSAGTAIKLAFVQEPTAVASGSTISPSVTVRALDINNNFVPTHSTDIVVAIDTNPSGGTLSGTLTKAPESGVSTFNDLAINYYGAGYKLTATSGSLLAATSAAFEVTSIDVPYDWPFTAGTSGDYTASSWTGIEFINDRVRLISTVQTDNAARAGTMDTGTASGVVIGTLTDGMNSGLRLGNGGGCDGATSDCAKQTAPEIYELHESWTPQWASLVSYWKMNESSWNGTANEVVDSRGSNHGVQIGTATTSSTAKLGARSGVFDGSGASARIADSIDLQPTTAITISAWIKRSRIGTRELFLGKGDTGNETTTFWLEINSSDQLRFMLYKDDSTAQSFIASDLSIPDTTIWHHLVATWDGSTQKIYLDGNLSTTTRAFFGTLQVVAKPFAIGRLGNAGILYFSGNIDDVAIWKNTALTASEVQTIYQRQKSAYSGTFTSRVMDAKSSSSWTTLSWMPTLPFFKELPDYASGAVKNETSADYTSLVGSTGSTEANDLMTGIVGLWHLNEASWNGTAGEVNDDSGNANQGRRYNNAQTVPNGRFARGGTFDGVNDYVEIPDSPSLQNVQEGNYSISAWFQPKSVPAGTGTANNAQYGVVMKNGNHAGIRYTNVKKFHFDHWFSDSTQLLLTSVNTFDPGVFYHVVGVVDRSNGIAKIYVNGVQEAAPTFTINKGAWEYGNARWRVGIAAPGAGNYRWAADGQIDEVAIWNRALHANEVKQLYQRGASRLKYQVRSCDDNACSGEPWLGPDGTSGTYFSELNNNTTPLTGAGDVKANLPSMLFSNFTSAPSNNQYFQYRTIFESDSTTAALRPELKSTTVDPLHYDSTSPSIYGNNGIPFSELNAFTENVTTPASTATCSSGIGYNLSLDKSTWSYWNGSFWATANGTATQSNIASVIQTNAATFGTQIGKGTVYVKAYLKSYGTTKCELDNIHVGGKR